MQDYAVYEISTGLIIKTVSLPPVFKSSIKLDEGQGLVEISRPADDTKEMIKDGKLLPIEPTEALCQS